MSTIIVTIIVSILLGFGTPINFLGANFLNKNLFSQISSNLPVINATNKLSETNPIKSLGKVTLPLDKVWEAISSQLKGYLASKKTDLQGPLKSSLTEGLDSQDTSGTWRVVELGKSAVVLVGNIFVAVLEIVLWLLKGLLGFLS